jgi:hypothetical protein
MTGVNFPDALASGPVSTHNGIPLAISRTDDIHDCQVAALQNAGIESFIVVGGAPSSALA